MSGIIRHISVSELEPVTAAPVTCRWKRPCGVDPRANSAASNYASSYAKAILAATRQADLARPDKQKRIGGVTPGQMERMEREMESLQRDFKAVEASYGDDVLNLVIASGYLSKLIGNRNDERYLGQHHPEILQEFKAIVSAVSLDHASVEASR
jgi:hypothetical protein